MTDPTDLRYFMELLRSRTGIALQADKAYLVEARLGAIAATYGFEGTDALLRAIRLKSIPAQAIDAAIDSMTTNETFFFRDQTPFEHLRRILVDAGRSGERTIRIWSAACSTGQEPYSIAMLWDEMGRLLPGARLEITASDISETCLAKARAGVYSAFEAQRGLPVQKLIKHFDQVGQAWQVKPDLGAAISWRRHNLLEPARGYGPFDVVFLRNVLIYFEPEVRRNVLAMVVERMKPGAHLMLGAAESVLTLSDRFAPTPGMAGLWKLKDAAGAAAA